MESIGKRIRLVRREMELTQKEFAIRAGITQAHVSNIESGKDFPSDTLIKLICIEYGVNEEWLKIGVGDMLDTNYEGEDEEIAKQVHNEAFIQLNELLKTKSTVEYAHYSYCMRMFAATMESHGHDVVRHLKYLSALERFYADFERFIRFMAYSSESTPKNDEEKKILENSFKNYINEVMKNMEGIYRAFIE